jgi:putative membrane protein
VSAITKQEEIMVDTAEMGRAIHRGIDKAEDEVVRVFKGAVAGVIAGALASWVMNRYSEIESKPVAVRRGEAAEAASRPVSTAETSEKSEGGDATVKTAQLISTRLLDHDLTDDEKKIAGPAVHYGYGTLVGGLYGFLAEIVPFVGIGLGIPYATLLWLGGDEVAVPQLGLGKPITETKPSEHASALASHFVYGVTLDIGRRIFKHLI